MRFLADENFPGNAVAVLRGAGHDVAWVRIEAPGSSDSAVLARAIQEDRILLTFDKDFGELAWRARLPAKSGIILFRLAPQPRAIAQIILGRDDWAGHFSVVEPERVRMRPLPRG